jgi:hypothetical protein
MLVTQKIDLYSIYLLSKTFRQLSDFQLNTRGESFNFNTRGESFNGQFALKFIGDS